MHTIDFNWATSVRDELNNLGFSDIWLNPYSVRQSNVILLEIKQRIFDHGKQLLTASLDTSPKCFLYKYLVDQNLSLQFYLTKYIPKKYRICLAKIRTSSHSLALLHLNSYFSSDVHIYIHLHHDVTSCTAW